VHIISPSPLRPIDLCNPQKPLHSSLAASQHQTAMCTHSICAYTQLATVTAVSGQQRVRNPSSCRSKLLRKSFVRGAALRQHAANGTKCTAFFKLGGQTSSGGGQYQFEAWDKNLERLLAAESLRLLLKEGQIRIIHGSGRTNLHISDANRLDRYVPVSVGSGPVGSLSKALRDWVWLRKPM
jgi:hypothetical protein